MHALSAVLLGDATSESAVTDAWATHGYDLDGWISTPAQTFHCQPQPGGKGEAIRTDGVKGVDNTLGGIVLPQLTKLVSTSLSDGMTTAARSGLLGMSFQMQRLGSATTGTDLTVVIAQARGKVSGDSIVPPPPGSWASYPWHPVANTATTVKDAYVTGGVMVARFTETFTVRLPLDEQTWELPLQRAIVTLDMNDPATGHGQIAGIVSVDAAAASMRPVLEELSTSLCGDGAFDAVKAAFRGAADILVDGTQDPARTCDGISVGIGFETHPTVMGDEVPAPTPLDPCAP